MGFRVFSWPHWDLLPLKDLKVTIPQYKDITKTRLLRLGLKFGTGVVEVRDDPKDLKLPNFHLSLSLCPHNPISDVLGN